MAENTKSNVGSPIELNNADFLVDKFASKQKGVYNDKFLTMLQGNTYSDVDITDSNIRNNSHFITNLWD